MVSSDVDHLEKFGDVWKSVYDPYINYSFHTGRPAATKFIEIPCGRCIGCRLQRSREWANRMMMEYQYCSEATFLTLTYDDEHLRFYDGVQPETGEFVKTPGLVLEDLQGFIKALRNKYRDRKIRYFACGEYGDKTQRPHYHLVIFGYSPSDKKFFSRGRQGDYNYFKSDELSKLWPFGFHIAADVTWESCAYTARYVTKKLYGEAAEVYDSKNIKPPFCVMSTHPGLGYQWYLDHRQEFDDDQRKVFYMATDKGSVSFPKPRYFRKLDDLDGFIPDDVDTFICTSNQNVRDSFELASDLEMQRKIISLSTDLDYFEELSVKELYKEQQTNILKRGVI